MQAQVLHVYYKWKIHQTELHFDGYGPGYSLIGQNIFLGLVAGLLSV
jgi:hypothetical protein